jgi:hypothetical protein
MFINKYLPFFFEKGSSPDMTFDQSLPALLENILENSLMAASSLSQGVD